MKLKNLIEYLKSEGKLLKFYNANNLDLDSEEISIYMKDEISIDAEIFFFKLEDTDGEVNLKKKGENFIYFFPLEHTAVLLEELDLLDSNLSDLEVAKRLVDYRIKDA